VTLNGAYMDLIACTDSTCIGEDWIGFAVGEALAYNTGYGVFFHSAASGGGSDVPDTFDPAGWHATIVPEPSAVILLLTVLLAVAYVARKRNAQGLPQSGPPNEALTS